MKYFVTAIGTDSGKSVVSAILVQALHADYWKPVQAGTPTDTDFVRSLVDNPESTFFNEHYLLKMPASPHAAAKAEGISLKIEEIKIPENTRPLVIEGAGGTLVPLNDQEFMIDLVPYCEAEIILVSNLYLGSINHTMLTIEYLKQKGYPVKGIIFNGEPNPESEEFILNYSGLPCLLRVLPEKNIDAHTVNRYALELKKNLEAGD
jgi:dethiobiotin synthetase